MLPLPKPCILLFSCLQRYSGYLRRQEKIVDDFPILPDILMFMPRTSDEITATPDHLREYFEDLMLKAISHYDTGGKVHVIDDEETITISFTRP